MDHPITNHGGSYVHSESRSGLPPDAGKTGAMLERQHADRLRQESEEDDAGITLMAAGNELLKNFDQYGGIDALQEGISRLRQALPHFPAHDQKHLMSLNNLSSALMTLYQQTGGREIIAESIHLQRQALELRPRGHPDCSMLLNNLASALITRYEQEGDTETLAEVIRLHHEALALRPQGHPDRGMSLNNLAHALMAHYQQAGDTEVLAQTINLHREALTLRPQGHLDRAMSLNNLANALVTHYQLAGDPNTLAEAVKLHREALSLRPRGHPDRVMSLNNLASVLMAHCEQTRDTDALAEMIYLYEEVLALLPQGYPNRATVLNNLASALLSQYEEAGGTEVLEKTIHLHREAIALCPKGHPGRSRLLNNLATALNTHYHSAGDPDSLAETIRLHREVLAMRPKGHPNRGSSLNNLASALMTRYQEAVDVDALSETIELQREVLSLLPKGHPNRGLSLKTFANALTLYYKQARDKKSLALAIHLYREALALHPQGHPIRSSSLSSLADALITYYQQDGSTEILEQAIQLQREALTLRPKGHPDHSASLINLANSYWVRFQHDGQESALSTAFKLLKEALETCPDGHPRKFSAHHAIARVQLEDSPHFSWIEALNHLTQATSDNSVSPRQRLGHAIESLRRVERTSNKSKEYFISRPALDIYVLVLQLLPQAAHVGLDLSTRLRELSGSEQLCRAASVRAMLLEQLPMAIEVFEEGKAVFWSQALRLRSTALDTLPAGDREKLSSLFRSLERLEDISSFSEDLQDKAAMESQTEHRRQLNKQADALIEDIRIRPGFDRFLKVSQYERLVQVAQNGFVVALIASEPLFFAIVIHANNAPEHIPLPSVKGDMLRKLRAQVSESGMRNYSNASEGTNGDTSRAMGKEKFTIRAPLEQAWLAIIQPIILYLGLKRAQGRQRPRIHWYPSGDFALLPLHAAGIYEGKNRVCATDFIVSSYTPSLSALIKSREGFAPVSQERLRVLAYSESSAPGQMHIPNVEEEVQTVAGILLSTAAAVINDVDAVPTAKTVLDQLPAAHILHLACHGQQHTDPLQSCFVLRDGPLTISALMKIDLPNAIIAFLSACETAKGDKNQPDQAVHLAASMLFCGFRSVVATMWTMYDDDGPRMAQWFYEALLEKEMLDLTDIPYALDTAVQKLRDTGAPAARWATYMHMGA